jgi:hypothetical protein
VVERESDQNTCAGAEEETSRGDAMRFLHRGGHRLLGFGARTMRNGRPVGNQRWLAGPSGRTAGSSATTDRISIAMDPAGWSWFCCFRGCGR